MSTGERNGGITDPPGAQLQTQNIYANHSQVQVHAAQQLNEARTRSLRILWVYLIYEVSELITTIVLLSIYWNVEYCTFLPLKTWIIVYSGRLIVRIPMTYETIRCERNQTPIPRWIDQLEPVLLFHIFATIFLANVWLYTLKACFPTSPVLVCYIATLTGIVYLYLVIPILTMIAIFVCLPCVLVIMYGFGINVGGASEHALRNLHHRKFDISSVPAGQDIPNCAICMNNFTNGSDITRLPCGHEFDRDCIQHWLRLKRQCALCRHDITQPVPPSQVEAV